MKEFIIRRDFRWQSGPPKGGDDGADDLEAEQGSIKPETDPPPPQPPSPQPIG